MTDYLANSVKESCKVKNDSFKAHRKNIRKVIDLLYETLKNGGKIVIFGNGGSAADAQHLAAEFVVRLKINRKAYPAIALTTDSSILTACANDFGFDMVFQRQVEALGRKGDVAIAISTSGNSQNVVLAVETAKKNKMKVVGFTGEGGGRMKGKCGILVDVKSNNTMRIQETHITFFHMICDAVETKLKG